MDIRNMTDAELDQHRRDVLAELERRQKLEVIPAEIDKLKYQYTAAGGNVADLDKGA